MSDVDTSHRPSQVTVGGWGAVAAGTLLLFSIFDTMGRLKSVDFRNDLETALTTGSAKGLGITVDEATEAIRWLLFASGAAAVVVAILGIWVLRRDRVARIVMTVALIPIVVAAPLTLFLSGVLAACVGMLWTRPARDWFAGRPVRQMPLLGRPRTEETERETPAPRPPAEPPRAEVPEVRPPAEGDSGDGPAPVQGFGQAPTQVTTYPELSPEANPYEPQPASWTAAPRVQQASAPGPMPPSVRIACLISYVLTGIAAVGIVAAMVKLGSDSAFFVDRVTETQEWREAGLDQDLLLPTIWVMMLMMLGWCVVACVLTWLTSRRHDWARYLLVVSSVVAAVFTVAGFPLTLMHLAGIGAVVWLLFSASSRAWFAGNRSAGQPPTAPPPGGPWQQGGPPPPSGPHPPGDRPKVW